MELLLILTQMSSGGQVGPVVTAANLKLLSRSLRGSVVTCRAVIFWTQDHAVSKQIHVI